MVARRVLPNFNDHGVLPVGLHEAALNEFEERFAFNRRRKKMLNEGLAPVIKELRDYGAKRVFVGGSYVTVAREPRGIDVFVPVSSRTDPLFRVIVQHADKWRRRFGVICVPAPEDEEDFGSAAFWHQFFAGWSNEPRGVVEIVIGA